MTAPSAPTLYGRRGGEGTKLQLWWSPVTDATSYKLYVGDTTAPTTLDQTVLDSAVSDEDGLFHVFSAAQADGPAFARLTAINEEDEESGYSNEVARIMGGPGTSGQPAAEPTPGLLGGEPD